MQIQTIDVIKACNLLISPNRGISLEEESILKKSASKLTPKNKLNAMEMVNVAQKIVYNVLGRKNITARDLKKAVFNIIDLT
jgi:hypothetical protein